MDLSYSAEDEQFRTELRSWLEANTEPGWREPGFWGSLDREEAFALRRDWEARKAEAGWAGISWPTEYGGRGGTPAQKAIYDEETVRAAIPATVNPLGLTFLAPSVMVYGTEEQKKKIIPDLLFNRVIWCQGFSEPGAGSDLAALQCKAEDQGDHWLVNGQKVWTTNAMHGDWIFTLCRTNPDAPRHAGISMLLIDMHAEGVEARPLKQMSGASEFGEVFFTDVRVPKDSILGPVDKGWEVAMTLLSFERGSSAMGQYTGFRRELDAVATVATGRERFGRPAAEDPALRQEMGRLLAELELLKLHSLHVLTAVEQGRELGFEASMTKLQWSETHQDLGELYLDIAELAGQETHGEDLDPLLMSALWSRSETIWGGSSQVQRNVVAERVLGLPR
ncbi:MAG: acyl-CoA dehydrogenase family protein [Mycobacteriales bacterium]